MDERTIRRLREHVRILERESGGVFEGRNDCCGVTIAQCHTLIEIGNRGDISLVDLAEALRVDASTMSRMIQGLVLIGLADRRSSDRDRRYVIISLTRQGRKVFAEIEARYNSFFRRVVERLPEGRREAVLASVGEFAEAVRRLNVDTECCRKGRQA